jgi:hypothetical protein
MLIATLDDALAILILSGGGIIATLVGAAFLFRWSLRSPSVTRKLVASLVAALLAGGGIVIGGFCFLVGLWIADCPPDAYECPF